MAGELRYIVVCQSAWCNSDGYGIDYHWDGEEFSARAKAKRYGFRLRESDDFNIAVLDGDRLVSFDWMDKPVGENDDTMAQIADELGLRYRKPRRKAPTLTGGRDDG